MIPTQYLIAALVFIAVIAMGGGVLLARKVRMKALRGRLGPVSSPVGDTDQATKGPWLLRVVGGLGRASSTSKVSSGLRRNLTRAGFQGDTPVVVFLGSKIALMVMALILMSVLTFPLQWAMSTKAMVVLGGAMIMFFLPNIIVRVRGNRRTAEIRLHLPDAVDLLEICVSGGMGLDQAWNVVTDEIANVCMLLSDEMAFTDLEIHLGISRSQAMRHLGERTGCQEALSMAATLTQSEQFGTSIGETLRVFADSMREARSQRASEIAEKMAVKLLFPLVFFIFPAILAVVAGPAGIQWSKMISGSTE